MYIQCKIETAISRVWKGIAAFCKMHIVWLGEPVNEILLYCLEEKLGVCEIFDPL